jgi:tetratricopeptide (TPR) repeat protein
MTTAPSLEALFDAGVAAHRAGRLAEARGAYEAILARNPDHFDALHMLGVAVTQAGEPDRGATMIARAIRMVPGASAPHINLAMALGALGRHEEALASADRALELDASSPDAHTNRGNALLALGRADAGLAAHAQALALRPADPQIRYNCGGALRALGRFDEAVACYDGALALSPTYVEALTNRGEALIELGRLGDALASFDAVLALRPTAEAHRNRGAVLARLRRLDEAIAEYDAALAADPASAQAHSDRASALNDLGRAAAALASADRAIALKSDFADAHNNRGVALFTLRRCAEARASYERALTLDPDAPEPRVNRALARLLDGDLAAGFEEYRWRWKAKGAYQHRPRTAYPEWEGELLAGKRLLVFTEQGFGDTLQFVRFVPRLAAAGADVTLLVEPPMVRLLGASLPRVTVTDQISPDAAFDAQAAMLCLPRLLGGVTLETIPAATPYLIADPAGSSRWGERLAALPGRKVGLVWAGASRRDNPAATAIDARRSLRLEQLAPLAAAWDVRFVSLQIGEPAVEAQSPPPGLRLVDWTSELGDFADTAALVASLDLVITVDTSVAHLAGALGRPVWILSRFDGCWRWLEDRDDSPWYPTARLFRQHAPGDWTSAIDAVAVALSARS